MQRGTPLQPLTASDLSSAASSATSSAAAAGCTPASRSASVPPPPAVPSAGASSGCSSSAESSSPALRWPWLAAAAPPPLPGLPPAPAPPAVPAVASPLAAGCCWAGARWAPQAISFTSRSFASALRRLQQMARRQQGGRLRGLAACGHDPAWGGVSRLPVPLRIWLCKACCLQDLLPGQLQQPLPVAWPASSSTCGPALHLPAAAAVCCLASQQPTTSTAHLRSDSTVALLGTASVINQYHNTPMIERPTAHLRSDSTVALLGRISTDSAIMVTTAAAERARSDE